MVQTFTEKDSRIWIVQWLSCGKHKKPFPSPGSWLAEAGGKLAGKSGRRAKVHSAQGTTFLSKPSFYSLVPVGTGNFSPIFPWKRGFQ